MSAFTPGTRVQLHPATDEWMRGDRYGYVTTSDNTHTTVRMDYTREDRVFPNNNLITVREG